MKFNKVTLLFLLLPIFGCHNQPGKQTVTAKDRLTDSINKQKAIDEQMAQGNRPDDEQEPPTQAEEKKRIINAYDQVQTIDTVFATGTDKLQFHLKYSCLKDSKIVVPKTYDLDNKTPKPFVTRAFVSTILLINNGDSVLNKQFQASDFNPFFEDVFGGNLKKYGSILMPEFSRNNMVGQQIVLAYSVSIPTTDIGIGLSLIITKDGKYKIVKNSK